MRGLVHISAEKVRVKISFTGAAALIALVILWPSTAKKDEAPPEPPARTAPTPETPSPDKPPPETAERFEKVPMPRDRPKVARPKSKRMYYNEEPEPEYELPAINRNIR